MKLLKKKTRKAVVKQARKFMKRHGPEAALGLLSGMVGGIITKAISKQERLASLLGAEVEPRPSEARGEDKKAKGAKKGAKKARRAERTAASA